MLQGTCAKNEKLHDLQALHMDEIPHKDPISISIAKRKNFCK